MESCPILPGQPLSPAPIARVLEEFYREGFALIPGVLSVAEIEALRRRSDEIFAAPHLAGTKYIQNEFILRNTIELDLMFRQILVRQPILGLAEAILGPDCKFCGQNVIRNRAGIAISHWHVDDVVEFPLPAGVERHDPRLRMPVQWFTVQMALSDIDSEEDGPTQFVPGSHYAGRRPNDPDHPSFEGRGPVSVFCKAGDIYLQNNQCWHRGAPHSSERLRYVLQSQYATRWAFTRFGEYNRVPVPEAALQGADARLLQVLGRSLS
ncbi:MAG: phytanoyl-CoA dioxygenase family protein [Candidatus Latescibacteria bacterium]|nr:phytanoyl-CoA dioxygenase family protein [Candidatus Latescibacterota bacterium]